MKFAGCEFLSRNGQKYHMGVLSQSELPELQAMLEKSQDFSLLTDGQPVQPDAAQSVLSELPPGKTLDDKLVLGIRNDHANLAGVLDIMDGYPEPGVCWIGLLEIPPEYRGMHLGYSVLSELEKLVVRSGIFRLQLGVLQDNLPALAFWQKMGFIEIRRKTDYASGQKTHVVLVMEKVLPASRQPRQVIGVD
jgi:ribosomal protein S18 acetylase RimI-like enzyme